jgi:hypothetical protein
MFSLVLCILHLVSRHEAEKDCTISSHRRRRPSLYVEEFFSGTPPCLIYPVISVCRESLRGSNLELKRQVISFDAKDVDFGCRFSRTAIRDHKTAHWQLAVALKPRCRHLISIPWRS